MGVVIDDSISAFADYVGEAFDNVTETATIIDDADHRAKYLVSKFHPWLKHGANQPNTTNVFIAEKHTPTLEEAQQIVGGNQYNNTVELIVLPSGNEMLVDEDGASKGLPVNKIATQLAALGLEIYGDVLIIPNELGWRKETERLERERRKKEMEEKVSNPNWGMF